MKEQKLNIQELKNNYPGEEIIIDEIQ